jgi:hypothetical protein
VVFRDSWGKGLFACSVLNPGGGNEPPEPVDVEGSVEYRRCGMRIARARNWGGMALWLSASCRVESEERALWKRVRAVKVVRYRFEGYTP